MKTFLVDGDCYVPARPHKHECRAAHPSSRFSLAVRFLLSGLLRRDCEQSARLCDWSCCGCVLTSQMNSEPRDPSLEPECLRLVHHLLSDASITPSCSSVAAPRILCCVACTASSGAPTVARSVACSWPLLDNINLYCGIHGTGRNLHTMEVRMAQPCLQGLRWGIPAHWHVRSHSAGSSSAL
jgi:hypothetical protein